MSDESFSEALRPNLRIGLPKFCGVHINFRLHVANRAMTSEDFRLILASSYMMQLKLRPSKLLPLFLRRTMHVIDSGRLAFAAIFPSPRLVDSTPADDRLC